MHRLLLVATALLLVAGCSGGSDNQAGQAQTPPPPATTGQEPAAMAATESATDGAIHGEVLETMDSGGYTYVHVKTADGDVWAAGPETPVAVGDAIVMARGMVMKDFTSKTLDRTFDEILFVGSIEPDDHAHAAGEVDIPAEHRDKVAGVHAGIQPVDGDIEPGSIAKAAGGRTIGELYAAKDQLQGQSVKVRGKVVKVVRNVMGTNWIHIQDGTGEGPSSDLAVTTDASPQVGDVVLVQGPVSVDKDFGAGYRYTLIVEGAAVTKE